MFIQRQGQVAIPDPKIDIADEELEAIMEADETGYGPLKHLKPIIKMPKTPPYWERPAPALGADAPVWL